MDSLKKTQLNVSEIETQSESQQNRKKQSCKKKYTLLTLAKRMTG